MVGVRRGRGPDTRLQRSWPVPDMPLKNKRLTPGRYQGTEGRGNWEADRQTDTLTGRKKKRLRERLVLLNGGASGSGVRSTQVLYPTFPEPSGSISRPAHSPLLLPGSAAPGTKVVERRVRGAQEEAACKGFPQLTDQGHQSHVSHSPLPNSRHRWVN